MPQPPDVNPPEDRASEALLPPSARPGRWARLRAGVDGFVRTSLAGAGLSVLFRRGSRETPRLQRGVAWAGLLLAAAATAGGQAQVAKAAFLNETRTSEVVFQVFEFPLAAFAAANPAFAPDSLAAIRLVFDRSPKGVVILDEVGLR